MTPLRLRWLRARIGAPSQRTVASLLAVAASTLHRLERGRRSARGLVLDVLLALAVAAERGADLGPVLDARRSRAERLAALFRLAYPEGR